MKSAFLEGLSSERVASEGLNAAFPDQLGSTKTVFDPDGINAFGWLYVGVPDEPSEQLGPFLIQGDCSGRYSDFDVKQLVAAALRRVQEQIGGECRDYGD